MKLIKGTSTQNLIERAKAAYPELDPEVIEKVVPTSIDTLYQDRDSGGTMHTAGANCALAVLLAMRNGA